MKTFQKVLCVMLSILMAMSCLSVAAFAAEGEKFTSTLKVHSTVSNKESAKVTLDALDELLKDLDICETVEIGSLGELEFDMRNINALCKTIDDYYLLIRFATILPSAVLGDLKELNLKGWEDDMQRPADDILILNEFVELIAVNNGLIKKICDGKIDLGVFAKFINLEDLLGKDGVSGMLRKMLVGILYKEGTAEFNKAYNDIDSFIYNDLVAHFTKSLLPGFKVSADSKIEDLLIDVYNICLEKYVKPELKKLNIDLSGSDVPELKALAPYLKLKGADFDLSGLALDANKSIKAQLNNVLGEYVKLFVPTYSNWTDGDYANLDKNIKDVISFIATKSGIIENADKKSLEEIGVEIALIILKNGDFGAYEDGIADCDNLEDMVSALLRNTAKEMKIGVNYSGDEGYLEVAGDIFAYWAYDNFNITDTNGKVYRAGGGKDVFEVTNYFLNYFLFDRAGAAVLGLSTTKTEDVFTKFDKLADYFDADKAVNFNSKNFMESLIDNLLSLDIVGLLDLTVMAALEDAGDVSAVKFIYNSVKYFLDNWAVGDEKFFPEYKSNAFHNALSNNSIANMVSVLLETVNNRKASVITLATFVAALVLNDETAEYAIESASVANLVATGKALSPKATVKAGGKTLTQNTDYIVIADAAAPGEYTATIKGIGKYEGEIERSFTVSMGKASTISYSGATTSSVKLSWSKVPYADSYTISKYDSAKKKFVPVKSGVTGTSYTVTGLSAGKEYKLSVQAVSSAYGKGEAKEITVYTVPSAVSSSKIKTTSTASSVKLSWSAVSGATHYKIERYSSKKWKSVTTTSKTSYTVSGLSGYTSYTFRVTALKKLPDGTYLAASPVTVKAKTLLGTPSSLKTSATASTMTLSWSKVTNADKYQVRQYSGGKWKTLATTKKTSYKISKLKAGTKYKFSVRAVVGKSTYGSAKEVSAYTLLPTPSKVKVASTATTSAKLSWSKVSGASSYEVYAYIGKKWTKVGSTKKTSITVKELPAGTKTKLKVRAVSKNVKSAFSSEVTALTLVSKVSSLKASVRKTTSITMTWKKTTGATSYEIYRYNGSKWKKIGTTKKTTYTDSKSLKKGTQYQYKVRAVQKVSKKTTRYGDYSSVLKAKTTIIGTARF